MHPYFSLAGRVALVTGGSRGIGQMIAQGLLEAGARVFICARDAEACADTATRLSAYGDCQAIPADLSSEAGARRLAQALGGLSARLDILVNNAGTSWGAALESYPVSGWEKVMQLNVTSVFSCIQQLLPLLRRSASAENPARVINIGSVAGISAMGEQAYAYGPSKAALHQLSRMLARSPRPAMTHSVSPIGYIRSCFMEKFAIPRQPLLAPAARGTLELLPPFDQVEALEGLEQVSHVWLLFLFHQALEDKPRLKVRPPRLGGNRSLGVFATRATHRPNGIGQSVVRLEGFEAGRLWLSGIDLLDGTPVLDIKPYVPYADAVADARNGIADAPPPGIAVEWSEQARRQAHEHGQRLRQPVAELIEQCLAQDPRPAYQKPEPGRRYGVRLWDLDVHWHYPRPDLIRVLDVAGGD